MTNLLESGKVLYISSVDISIGNGPGVNEREFIVTMYKMLKERAHFLIPKPQAPIAELPDKALTFSAPHKRHNPLFFPGHVMSEIHLADKILSERQFDLLLFRLDILPLAPFYITKKYPIPYALKTIGQGAMNALAERGGLLGKSLMGFNWWLFQQIVKNALVADSVSTAQVKYLENLFKIDADKIVWIDNAVNTERFFPIPVEEARDKLNLTKFYPIVGYVGTRPWERGGMQLIETAPQLLSKYPNLGIVILGDGNELDKLKQRAKELNITEHCIFTGYVPLDQVPLYVNSLDVGVSISTKSDRYAAAELKVRQYLACGKPIVVSPGSNDFVMEENLGSMVPPNDLNAITASLEKWLSLTVDERNLFSQRAVQYMKDNFSMEAAVNKRLKMWSEILKSST